jgi:hypothetical protein
LEKNSFTLFETLLSITLLILIVSGFLNSSYYDQTNHQNFMLLNSIENKFDIKDYSGLQKSSKNLKITINDTEVEFLSVKKYVFENEDIKILKYEK